jgi:hypothetical protein
LRDTEIIDEVEPRSDAEKTAGIHDNGDQIAAE